MVIRKSLRSLSRERNVRAVKGVGEEICAISPLFVAYGSFYCSSFLLGLSMWTSSFIASTLAVVSLLLLARMEKKKRQKGFKEEEWKK